MKTGPNGERGVGRGTITTSYRVHVETPCLAGDRLHAATEGIETRLSEHEIWLSGGDYYLFFWLTRDHSSLFKSMYEEHLCVVALTSIERGTQFFPLASYFLV